MEKEGRLKRESEGGCSERVAEFKTKTNLINNSSLPGLSLPLAPGVSTMRLGEPH